MYHLVAIKRKGEIISHLTQDLLCIYVIDFIIVISSHIPPPGAGLNCFPSHASSRQSRARYSSLPKMRYKKAPTTQTIVAKKPNRPPAWIPLFSQGSSGCSWEAQKQSTR